MVVDTEREAHEGDPLIGGGGSDGITSNLDLSTIEENEEAPSSSSSPTRRGRRDHHRRQSSLTTIVENLESIMEGAIEFTQDIVETVQDSAVVENIGHAVESVQESAVEVKDAIVESAVDVKDAIVEEAQEVKDVFLDELHQADEQEDKFFFLEMQLTRNLSILPQDVSYASEMVPDMGHSRGGACTIIPRNLGGGHHERHISEGTTSTQDSTEDTMFLAEKTQDTGVMNTPMFAYLLLASAVIALSSIGPILELQKDVESTMKVFWRTSATAVLLLPFASYSIYKSGFPRLSSSHWITLLMAAGSYAALCVFFVWALHYTSVGNAVILSNSQALILLAGKAFVGHPISNLEAIGAIVAFSGAILCSKDSSEVQDDVVGGVGAMGSLLGDVFAISSACAGVAYLVLAKTVRPEMDVYIFMFFVMSIGSLQTLIFIFMAGEPLTFDANYSTGIFGWIHLDADRLPLEIIMALVCNFFGAMGYVRAMHYFDNLVISVAALMEPVVAEFLSFILSVGDLPGWKGWLGNALVAAGTLAVVYQPGGGKSSGHH